MNGGSVIWGMLNAKADITPALAIAASGNRPSAFREVQSWISYLGEVLGENVWLPISPMRSYPVNSQVLQKRRGYKDILHYDMSLRMGLQLPWKRAEVFADGLVGDIRPVSELYEYWCFFMLRKAIASLATEDVTVPGSAFDTSNGKLEIRLQKGRRSRVRFTYSVSPTPFKINLFYNRVFPRPNRDTGWHGSYTSRFDPDYSLELIVGGEGEAKRHWLHFDAKYRTKMVALGAAALEELQDAQVDTQGSDYISEMARFHKQEDLFKMHTYRDGILGSRGAYILFPGDAAGVRLAGSTQNLFVRHPTAFGVTPQHLFPSVGAFEFCPGRETAQIPVLVEFLRGVFDAVSLGQPYSEERALFL